jgi:histidyl-tRNA synthetase
MFSKIKGTQDFLDCNFLQGVLHKIFRHVQTYNFKQIETPILESVTLFERGLGYETDVVSKQMFIIDKEKSSEVICLRPEATAGTMRAFVENQGQLTLPWKVFSYGPMFRYERPQKGRFRQFHQVNIESIGVQDIMHDALFITMLSRLFEEVLDIENFVLHINFLGSMQDRENFKQALHAFLQQHVATLCDTCLVRKESNILRVFDCKSEQCIDLYKQAPKLTDHLCQESQQEWNSIKDTLHQLSVTFIQDPYLVRGLDYYNKTVFEFVGTTLGAQNAFCGGGRYDGLAQQLGAKQEVASIGAAIGIERLLLLLEDKKDEMSFAQQPLVYVLPCEQEQNNLALFVVDALQQAGICSDVLFDGKLKAKLKKANKLQASYVVLIGQDEQQENFVTVKDMTTGSEERVIQSELVSYFTKLGIGSRHL